MNEAKSEDGCVAALVYPVVCHLRVIVDGSFAGAPALQAVLDGYTVSEVLASAAASRAGRYHSWQVAVRVHSREEMVRLDHDIRAVAGVKVLL